MALRRAVHQIRDLPVVFNDPLAVPILGTRYAESLAVYPARAREPFAVAMRAHLVARSRYAEDNLSRAVASGVTQYVQLGAGLDTFAYRKLCSQLQVFEVDHPATQAWKRELLARSGISIPANVTYAPVDFERQSLATELRSARFDAATPAFFAWLGVVPYLTLNAFRSTVEFVASHPTRSGLVFDYGLPREALPPREQLVRDMLASRVEDSGEPFQLFFTPDGVSAELSRFSEREDLGSNEINARYFEERSDGLAMRGSSGRLLSASIL